MEVDRMFYIQPNLKNMSQGARLEYIREVRHMTKDDVTILKEIRIIILLVMNMIIMFV